MGGRVEGARGDVLFGARTGMVVNELIAIYKTVLTEAVARRGIRGSESVKEQKRFSKFGYRANLVSTPACRDGTLTSPLPAVSPSSK